MIAIWGAIYKGSSFYFGVALVTDTLTSSFSNNNGILKGQNGDYSDLLYFDNPIYNLRGAT